MNYTFRIIFVCLVVGLFQAYAYDFMIANFALVNAALILKPWMVVTALFLHADIGHFLLNMISLGIFGSILEHIIGKKKYLIVFFTAGIVANILSTSFYPVALGASGAILGLMGTLAFLRPKLVIYVYFIPMRLWFAVILYAALDTFGIFFPSGVGNIAHLAGLIVGLIFGYFYQKKYGAKRMRYQPIRVSDAAFDNWEDQYMKPKKR